MQSIPGGKSRDEVLDGIFALTDFCDEYLAGRYNELEALLFLHPELVPKIVDLIEAQLFQENFDVQLSVVMEAISTMETEAIEENLLDFAYRYQEDANLTYQTVSVDHK